VEVLPMRARTRELRKDRINPHLPFAALADASLYTLRLARRLRAIRPDIVHTNTLKGGVYGSLAARLAGIPSVWHVRDRIARDYLPRSAVVVLRRLIAKIPNGVIANSESTRSTLRSPPERTLVMHSIIHDPVSAPRPKAGMSHGGPLVVGMVGRLARWKGQHVFLAAFADAFGDGDARAIVVGSAMFGDAENRYAKELHAQVAGLGIGERVEFRGFRHDVWSELADMDVLVHASITPEPFGQVIVEAMLAGVPVIAVAGGGPSEIVTDGVDGLLYPPGNVKALSAALTRLASDPDLREQLSVRARGRAAAFSPEAAAAGAMSMYSRVLESGRRGV
jgi:glycosyltransferase involved in cell wall biosynthesis